MKLILPLIFILFHLNCSSEVQAVSFYDFKVSDIQGKSVDLSRYKGKSVLVVNVASKCGYTSQYDGLEKLYKNHKDKGFVIIGFPANNFGAQEPGSNQEIAEFCRLTYGVSFDMMGKISVKGEDKHPLYEYLTNNAPQKGDVKWNFEKFLIGKDGTIKGRFPSSVAPEDTALISAIQKEL
ncbi:MAG: glutathione peroxidase [Leptospira sp.]|nr:glutathione peroxidase [Leptospira sp.]